MVQDDSAGQPTNSYIARELSDADAGEILTLQRAAYLSEARLHRDFDLPPLTQSLDNLRDELARTDVVALGVREGPRLLGAVRLRRTGATVELGRLTVVPDRQGKGIGTFLLRAAETAFPDVDEIRLFTGEHSAANIRLYERHGYAETLRTPAGGYALVHFVKALTAVGETGWS